MKNIGHILAITCLGVLAAAGARAETTMDCACQFRYTCGADECEPAEGICPGAIVEISQSPARIRYCVAGNCLEGEAAMAEPREEQLWLHGFYRHSLYPEQNDTSVTVLLDRSTGLGFLQSSDGEGINQVSLICTPRDE